MISNNTIQNECTDKNFEIREKQQKIIDQTDRLLQIHSILKLNPQDYVTPDHQHIFDLLEKSILKSHFDHDYFNQIIRVRHNLNQRMIFTTNENQSLEKYSINQCCEYTKWELHDCMNILSEMLCSIKLDQNLVENNQIVVKSAYNLLTLYIYWLPQAQKKLIPLA